MKFAIMAGIHANLKAFRAVLEDARARGCTHHAFLGDFVAYCADPKACHRPGSRQPHFTTQKKIRDAGLGG